MTRSQKSYIKILRNSNTEFVYSCTFFKRINMICSFLTQAALLCSTASFPAEYLLGTFQGPVIPEDVKTDTPKPVCSYWLLTYKTSYQFVGIKKELFHTEPAPLSKDSTSRKVSYDSMTCLILHHSKSPICKICALNCYLLDFISKIR